VDADRPDPLETFETWLLRRVAHAVEGDELPADLLAELSAGIEDSRKTPQEENHPKAVREIADALEIPSEEVEQALTIIEAQPTVTREMLMRQIAEAWLDSQRKAYREEELDS